MTASTARTATFGPLEIEYDDQVLEPRDWTLAQSEWAAALLAHCRSGPVLELCAGAGQIGLAAAALSGRPAVLVDSSAPACAYALRNARAAGIADRVDVRHSPMNDALRAGEEFAMVLADPPYIPSTHTGRFPADPLIAIDGGRDGLNLARLCLEVAAAHLAPAGHLLIQLRDHDQADRLWTDQATVALPSWSRVEAREFDGRGVVLHLVRTEHA